MHDWRRTYARMIGRLSILMLGLALLGASCAPGATITADAGADRTVAVGATVSLDGSESSDPRGLPLTFAWSFEAVPAGSSATLADPQTATPTFVPDLEGHYVIELTVSNGVASATDTVRVEATPSSTSTLGDGEVVEGLDGVAIGAVEGSLASSIDVSVQHVEDPSPATPFPPETSPVSSFYRVSFSRDENLAQDRFFVFGIPVPDGTSTDSLAIAVFRPPDPFDEGDGDTPEWVLYPGTYDAESNMVFVAFPTASADGHTAVLVQGDQLDSTPVESVSPAHVGFVEGFDVRCVGFSAGECTQADRDVVRDALDEVHAAYVDGLGFNEPRLLRRIQIVSLIPLHVHYGAFDYMIYDFEMDVCNDQNGRGRYLRSDSQAYTCYDPAQPSPSTRTTRHEFFHALQYGYPTYLASRGDVDNAFAEGTARSAESSQNGLRRSNRALRDVDVGLFDDNSPAETADYEAQDFWVYLGFRFGMDLDYLIPMLQAGARLPQIDSVLQNESSYPENLTLGQAYWDWVKNQTFEQNVNMGDPARYGDACAYTPGTATVEDVAYEHVAPPNDRSYTVGHLTSKVVKLDFAAMPDAAYSAQVNVSRTSSLGRVKFYDAADAGTTACRSAPESNLLNVEIPAGTDRTFYIVMSNTSRSNAMGFTVSFTVSPDSVEILSPAPAAQFDEGDTIAFKGVATGFQGENPDLIGIQWTYTRSNGVPFTLATTKSGETFTTKALCDRSYTVTATVTGASSSPTDSIGFSVADLGDTSPPAECPVGIDITSPPSGSSFALGTTLDFEGVVTNDRPWDDDLRYPITWRDGGPSGSIMATNTLAFSTAGLSVGTHSIYVDYGAASDQITVEIVDEADPPTVSIDSPPDGELFTWFDDDDGGFIDVDFVGSGDGAGLTYAWSFRKQGASSYVAAGTGTTTTIRFNYNCENITTYDVRLVGEDSGGLTATDQIAIQIQSPPC